MSIASKYFGNFTVADYLRSQEEKHKRTGDCSSVSDNAAEEVIRETVTVVRVTQVQEPRSTGKMEETENIEGFEETNPSLLSHHRQDDGAFGKKLSQSEELRSFFETVLNPVNYTEIRISGIVDIEKIKASLESYSEIYGYFSLDLSDNLLDVSGMRQVAASFLAGKTTLTALNVANNIAISSYIAGIIDQTRPGKTHPQQDTNAVLSIGTQRS